MRIHTNENVTLETVRAAARKAGVYLETLSEHGSRSHDHAFEVHLSGSSSRRGNGKDYKAATWDEWGVFLNSIFEADPEAKCWAYEHAGDFHFKTFDRFDSDFKAVPGHNHRWDSQGNFTAKCKSEDCTAQMRWR